MRNLVISNLPQSRRSLNLGEYAEEAAVLTEEQPIKEKRPLFIEANTVEATLEHLRNDCIIPVFAKIMKPPYRMFHSLKQCRMRQLHSLTEKG